MNPASIVPSPRLLPIFAAAAIAGLMAPSPINARMLHGSYDGVWNVVFATRRGTCTSGYSVPFMVTGSRVTSGGEGRVSGSVNRAGAVAVQITVGASHASGGGRLAGNSGAGSWRGIMFGDACSGTWRAKRT